MKVFVFIDTFGLWDCVCNRNQIYVNWGGGGISVLYKNMYNFIKIMTLDVYYWFFFLFLKFHEKNRRKLYENKSINCQRSVLYYRNSQNLLAMNYGNWREIWKLEVPKRIRSFIWLVLLHGRIMIKQ